MLNFNENKPKSSIFDSLYSNANVNSLQKRMAKKGNLGGASSEKLAEFFAAANEAPLSTDKIAIEGLPERTGLGATASLAGNWIADHKLKSAGLRLLGAGNVAGLFDNPNIIGQLVGLGGGLAAGKLLPGALKMKPFTNSGVALATMGGGFLGSLFDKLMAAKAEEEAAMQAAYAGQY
jgi:hypothetical protein